MHASPQLTVVSWPSPAFFGCRGISLVSALISRVLSPRVCSGKILPVYKDADHVGWGAHPMLSGSQLITSCFSVTPCYPMDCSIPGSSVLHHLMNFAQIHFHWVSDTIQPPYFPSSPSPPALNLSQHHSLFRWVESGGWIRWLKHWRFSFGNRFPMNIQSWFPLGLTGLISLLSGFILRYWMLGLQHKNLWGMLSRFSHVQLCVTLWTIAHQAPLSKGFCKQEEFRGGWTQFSPSLYRKKRHSVSLYCPIGQGDPFPQWPPFLPPFPKSQSPVPTICPAWRLAACRAKFSGMTTSAAECAQEPGSCAKVLMFYCTSKAKSCVWTQATEVSENKSENSITHSSTVNDPFHLHCQFKGRIVHMFFLWSCGKNIDMVWHVFLSKT